MNAHKIFLQMAVEEAAAGIRARDGGPFGAIVVRDGKVIGRGHNCVLSSNDPTAHAEISAIRNACALEKNPHLTGATLYSNFEPCPMCLAAIYWADIRHLYFCSDREKASDIGFMDRQLYEEFARLPGQREMNTTQIGIPEMDLLLEEWKGLEDKIIY
ncbi:MAG: nucleoside deaminase [Bacteroidia bacterium]|jgi:guanine deaminase|nr:MAG: nucleoside deaminase [Bacteroidia bacterium]